MILHTSERMREIWDKYSYHAGLKNPTGSYKMFLRVFLYTGPYKIQGVLYFGWISPDPQTLDPQTLDL